MQRSDSNPISNTPRNSVLVAGHEVTLFAESPPLLAAMTADMRAARTRIWMETYIYVDDDAGREIADVLIERAQAGLDVRLMVDGFGSFSLPRTYLNRLRAGGVQVHEFHALRNLFKAPRFLQALNQRNHRKLLVIDDEIAYFGGMNVVDQSGIRTPADAKERHLPKSAGWRDVHARLHGPRQAEIVAVMERLWRRVHKQPREKPPRWKQPDFAHAQPEAFYFFDSRPTFKDRRPHRILAPLLQQARQNVTVLMAYFVPLGRVLRELLKARRRGVRVTVVVPGQSDVKIVQWASRHLYEFLLMRGIRIFERRERMLHSKALVVDGEWSVVGSCNLDARSLRINLEFFAVIRSKPLAAALERIAKEEMQASQRVDADYCRRLSWWQRSLGRAAWGLRKWL